MYLDGIYLKRGFREILGVCEGGKEDKASWLSFLRHLKQRRLQDPKLIISDKCLGLVETLGECFPDARWQRCVVHFYRNVFSAVPKGKIRQVASMLKAIHAQEDLAAARSKIQVIVKKLRDMKLSKAADYIADGAHETLSYYYFPEPHWRRTRVFGLRRSGRQQHRPHTGEEHRPLQMQP